MAGELVERNTLIAILCRLTTNPGRDHRSGQEFVVAGSSQEIVEALRHAAVILRRDNSRIEALERENATLRAERAILIEDAATIARNFGTGTRTGEAIAAAIRNMGGGEKTQGRDNLSEQPHGDSHDSAFHPAERTAEEPATDGDRGAEGAGQGSRTGGHSRPLLGGRARADDQSGDSGFGNSLTTAGRDALEKERGE